TPRLPQLLAMLRTDFPNLQISLRSDHFEAMLRDLRQGDLNLLIGVSETGTDLDARHQWSEPMVWMRSPSFTLGPDMPVPLVTSSEGWPVHRAAVSALSRAQRDYEVVFIGQS